MYRAIALALAIAFAAVGLVFLCTPATVVNALEQVAHFVGGRGMPAADVDSALFRALAVAYMYVVTLLAWMMFRQPASTIWPALLAHAKFASAAVSLLLFVTHTAYLVYVANGIIDGLIGLLALALRRYPKRMRQATSVEMGP